MPCPRCKARVKDWNGDDPKCGFEGGTFTSRNWNCATLNDLRDLAEQTRAYGDDHSAAVIAGEDGFVLLRWYKNRGCTEAASWLPYGSDPPEPLTLRQAEEVLIWNGPLPREVA